MEYWIQSTGPRWRQCCAVIWIVIFQPNNHGAKQLFLVTFRSHRCPIRQARTGSPFGLWDTSDRHRLDPSRLASPAITSVRGSGRTQTLSATLLDKRGIQPRSYSFLFWVIFRGEGGILVLHVGSKGDGMECQIRSGTTWKMLTCGSSRNFPHGTLRFLAPRFLQMRHSNESCCAYLL